MMITALRLASYAGVAAIALAVGSIPNSTAVAQPRPAAQPAAGGVSNQECQQVLDRVREMSREAGGYERKLDLAQKQLNAAKGEARVDELVKLVNEMANDRTIIRRKEVIIDRMIDGHLIEHIRQAKNFQDLQQDLQHCVAAAYLERIARGGGADEEGAPGATPMGTPEPTPKK